jgi:hypothetical protein
MATIATVPLATVQVDKFPVQSVANGIVPDEALAVSFLLGFSPSAQALVIDLTEGARKYSDLPIQGAFIDMSLSTIDLSLQVPATGQSIIAKAGSQGYYPIIATMPVRVVAILASAPIGALNIPLILYNTVIEPEVWGITTGATGTTGPQGPQGPVGLTGPAGPPGPQGPSIVPATATVLGGVKIGANVSVLPDGTISTPIQNVFGRTGAVIPTAGDYTAAMVTSAVSTIGSYADPSWLTALSWPKITGTPSVSSYQTPWLSNISAAGFQLSNAGQVAIGTTSALYKLEVRSPGSTASQVHLASTDTDAGAYLTSLGDANGFVTAGAAYNGTAWIAKSTSASSVQLGAGNVILNGDTGLTIGSAFTPSGRLFVLPNGNVGIGTGSITHQLELSLDSAAKPTTNTWTITSDMRTKRNVKHFEGGMEIIRKLQPVVSEYNGKAGTPEGGRVVSLDPVKLREVVPHAVSSVKMKLSADDEEETDVLGVNNHEVIYHMLLAIQQIDKHLTEMAKGKKK